MEYNLIEQLENEVKELQNKLERTPGNDSESKKVILHGIQVANYRLNQLYGE